MKKARSGSIGFRLDETFGPRPLCPCVLPLPSIASQNVTSPPWMLTPPPAVHGGSEVLGVCAQI